MKYFLFVLFLIKTVSVFSQNNNFLNPKTGKIVFNRTIEISNQKKIDSSVQEYKKKLLNSLLKTGFGKSFDNPSEPLDTSIVRNYVDARTNSYLADGFKYGLPNKKEEYWYYEFKDTIIVSYVKVGDYIKNDYKIINRRDTTTTYLKSKDSLTRYKINEKYRFFETNGKLKEYRDNTKIINGYTCFKVVYTVDPVNGRNTPSYILYVTESIKSSYHPIIKIKEILNQYYPLEVTEKHSAIDGISNAFYISELKIN